MNLKKLIFLQVRNGLILSPNNFKLHDLSERQNNAELMPNENQCFMNSSYLNKRFFYNFPLVHCSALILVVGTYKYSFEYVIQCATYKDT